MDTFPRVGNLAMKPQRQADGKTRYTVADYLGWPDDIRCELIDGAIYDMSPAPVVGHQQVVVTLTTLLNTCLNARRSDGGGGYQNCQLLVSPIDVVLFPDTVVQPDLIVVCDPAKLANGKHVLGAPDLVVEVLSPSTALKDKREKRRLYEKAGVAEYLIVDPAEFYAEYYRLEGGTYGLPSVWGGADVPRLALFPELEAKLGEIFGWPNPDEPLAITMNRG